MKFSMTGLLVVSALLTGCASGPPAPRPSELGANVKSVAFVQYGEEPHRYAIGAVDGKTSWAGPGMEFTPATSSRADVQGAAVATLVSAIGQKIAQDALKEDPDYYTRILMKMVGERKLTSEVAPLVMPEMAAAWGLSSRDIKILRRAKDAPLATQEGNYPGDDPGTDLVLTYEIERLLLSEKPTLSVLFKAVGTAGMYDRPVVPYMLGKMTAFKRNESGQLKQVWTAKCSDFEFLDGVNEQWVVLKEQPEKAAPVFDSAVLMAAKGCKRTLAQLNR